MYKILRIVFCVLSVCLTAAAIFVLALVGWLWGLLIVIGAAVCGALMVTFKTLQEKEERKANPPPTQGDFITGKVSHSEEPEDKE